MNLGPLALPVQPLIFLLSVGVALVAGLWLERERRHVERAIFLALLIGLAAARLGFVVRYFPDFRENVVNAFDVRDRGFDSVTGLVAAVCTLAFFFLRSRPVRLPLLGAIVAGLLVWGTANAAVDFVHPPSALPAISLSDSNGHMQSLAAANCMPTVVNLWATWCGPCQTEMPVLAQAQADYPGVRLLFVNQGETEETVESFLASRKLAIAHSLLDPAHAVAAAVGAIGFPTTLFYDAHGRLLAAHLGPFSKATFRQAIETFYAADITGASS